MPDDFNPFEIAILLLNTKRFDEVLFNVFMKLDGTPNDPQYNNQWNLSAISMSNAWDTSVGDTTIIVAVIDVGGDYDHEDLAGNRWSGTGYDFYDNDDDPYPDDEAGHGTAVAGILGAVTNNNTGIAGIAGGWIGSDGARIMHLDAGYRTWDPYAQQYVELISLTAASQATDSAAVWGARVINMSFGGGDYTPLQSAINRAVNNYNVVVIASAGNYRQGQSTTVRYPAAYSNVIAVGATTPDDTRKELNDGTESWWGSCYGPQLDVMAPGVYIRTTDLTGSIGYSTGNYYDSFNGTSAAAPHVAGVAALIRSLNTSLSWQQVRDQLRLSADKVPGMDGEDFTDEYGYGRLNANKAVRNMYVPQVYPNIASAVSAAVSGQTIYVSSGNYTLTSNVIIPSDVTLTLLSGANVNFNGRYIDATNGVFNIQNGSTVYVTNGNKRYYGLFTSVQSAMNFASSGRTVQLLSMAYTGNLSFSSKSNVTLKGQGQGSTTLNSSISVTNSSSITVIRNS
jgi:subtilisin family serine protease